MKYTVFGCLLLSSLVYGCTQLGLSSAIPALKRSTLVKGPHISGGIQGVSLNAVGNGYVFWSEHKNQREFALTGSRINHYQPSLGVLTDFNSSSPYWADIQQTSEENSEGFLLIGNLQFDSISLSAFSYPLYSFYSKPSQSEANLQNQYLGSYKLLAKARHKESSHYLLTGQDSSWVVGSAVRDGAKVNLLELSAQGALSSAKVIKTIPNNESGILAGATDEQGNGLVFWRNSEAIFYQEMKAFQMQGEERGFAPAEDYLSRLPITLEISNGNGFIAWPAYEEIKIFPIKNNILQEEAGEVLGIRPSIGRIDQSTTYPMAYMYDLKLSPSGEGWFAWITPDHKKAYYQRIKNFKRVDSPRQILQNAEGMQFGMLKFSTNEQGPPILVGLDLHCSFDAVSGDCLVKEYAAKELWISEPLL
ncbi:MAG: hypothetical protein ACO1RX_14295 [Candidatus Sericytochromatia bacterium]